MTVIKIYLQTFQIIKIFFKKISEMSYIKIYKERNSCDLLSTGPARCPLEQTRLCLSPK